MPKVFISYRREDSGGQAGRLFDHLTQRFGEDNVFMDVDTIDLGLDFKPALQDAVRRCDIMLVVIGRDWLDSTEPGTSARRLDKLDDWVRIEIAEALRRDIPVVPVLVRGATVLSADRLPSDIAALADRQTTSITDSQWRAGVADLISRLEAIPRRREQEQTANWLARVGLKRLALFGGVTMALLAAVAWMIWPVNVDVPEVTGKQVAQARSEIERAGLNLPKSGVAEEESLAQQAGTVIRQDPSAGLRVSKGGTVKLVVAKTPAPVDLSRYVTIRATGEEGAIGLLAAVTAIESALAHVGRKARLSERYLYEKAKRHDELKESKGTWMTTIVYVAEQFGVAPYELWPYEPNQHSLPKGMTWERLDAAAAKYKTHFHRIAGIDDIYQQLRGGRPVVAGVSMGSEWQTADAVKTGRIELSDSRQIHGRGVVAFVGFDPSTGLFRFANSWGKDWGDKGFGTMSLATAKTLVEPRSLWAVEATAGK